jgi:rSAM/selenodomain-associated transferase 2
MAAAGLKSAAVPLYSIIIPVLHEQANINACLRQVAELREAERAEVIVADGGGGSTVEAIESEKRPYLLRRLICPRGRGRQQNAGAAAARGPLLLFLHVDTRLPRHGLCLLRRTLSREEAGAFSFAIPSPRALFRLWLQFINWRMRLLGTPYGDQAIFLRADAFRRLGGFRDLPLMEDVDLVRRLRRSGVRLHILATRALTSDRRWRRRGYLANLLRNTGLYLLYRLGVAPSVLAAAYPPDSSTTLAGANR